MWSSLMLQEDERALEFRGLSMKQKRGKKMVDKRKGYNVPEEKYLRLERMAVDMSYKVGKTIKWTEIITYLIDNYAKDAVDDMTSKEMMKKKTKN